MATYLNADIPPIYCKVRKEYLYDLKEHKGESLECVVFGITSVSVSVSLSVSVSVSVSAVSEHAGRFQQS